MRGRGGEDDKTSREGRRGQEGGGVEPRARWKRVEPMQKRHPEDYHKVKDHNGHCASIKFISDSCGAHMYAKSCYGAVERGPNEWCFGTTHACFTLMTTTVLVLTWSSSMSVCNHVHPGLISLTKSHRRETDNSGRREHMALGWAGRSMRLDVTHCYHKSQCWKQ